MSEAVYRLWARKNGDTVEIVNSRVNPNFTYKDNNEFFLVEDKYKDFIDDCSTVDVENKKVMPNIDSVRTTILSDLAHLRWEFETNTVTLPNGHVINTDRESRGLISDCYASFKEGFITSTRFKTLSGWVDVDSSTISMIAGVVAKHTNSCFIAETIVSDRIKACASVDEMLDIRLQESFDLEYSKLFNI